MLFSRCGQGHSYLSHTGSSLTHIPQLIAHTPRRGYDPTRRKHIVARGAGRGNDKVGLHKVFTYADRGVGGAAWARAKC